MNRLARGFLAGFAGTGVMTAYQLAVAKARGQGLDTPVPRTWAEAPAPAQVAKRAADALGRGRRVTKQDVPRLTNAMHWLYGLGWGVAYGAATGGRRQALGRGLVFGTAVWGAAYAQLVPLGIYKPPWEHDPAELGIDLSYHLVYGLGVAGAYAALEG